MDSFNTPIQLTYKDQWGEVTQDILPGTVLNLYEGFYEIEIKDPNSNFIMPITDAFYLSNDLPLYYDLSWSKVLYAGLNENDWISESGDWSFSEGLRSQSSFFYDNDYHGVVMLDSLLTVNEYLVAVVKAKYELEWGKDYFDLFLLDNDGNFLSDLSISDQHFSLADELLLFADETNGQAQFKMNISTDESLYYRGVVVDHIEILTLPEEECPYGDVNHDGILNVNDILKLLNYALDYEIAEGYYRCASDINDDGMINIQDIINLVFLILEGE